MCVLRGCGDSEHWDMIQTPHAMGFAGIGARHDNMNIKTKYIGLRLILVQCATRFGMAGNMFPLPESEYLTSIIVP